MPLLGWWVALWFLLALRHPPLAASGAKAIWRVAGEGHGQAAVNGELACFLTRDHQIIAVDCTTGAERWRNNTGEPGDETLGSAVVMAGGGCVFAGDYALFAFDAATGIRRWRFEPADGYGPGLYLGDAAGEMLFAGSPAGRLYAVRQDNGRLVWSASPAAAPRTTVFQPVVSEDALAAGYSTFGSVTTGGLVMLDRRTGRQLWRREFVPAAGGATGFGGGPVFTRETVIAASGDGSIRAFDRASGAPRWTLPPITRADGRPQDRDWRALAVSGTTLVAGSVSGAVIAVDVATGRTKWRYAHPEGGSMALRISVDDRTAYVPHFGGLLVAIDIGSGRLRWQIGGLGDGFNWAPIVAGNTVLAVASRLGLVALPR